MTRQWQLMRDAQTFLDASKLANDALIGIHFAEIARQNGQPIGKTQLEKIDKGIKLLDVMSQTLEAREKQEAISPEAVSVLYVLSQGRKVSSQVALKRMLKDSITELQDFKNGKIDEPEEAEDFLEIVANSTSEEASKATSKVHIFMAEAR
ncbi:MAG: hypothetical protein ABSD42_13360 [Candidatus Bathyarchaeia archaeon]